MRDARARVHTHRGARGEGGRNHGRAEALRSRGAGELRRPSRPQARCAPARGWAATLRCTQWPTRERRRRRGALRARPRRGGHGAASTPLSQGQAHPHSPCYPGEAPTLLLRDRAAAVRVEDLERRPTRRVLPLPPAVERGGQELGVVDAPAAVDIDGLEEDLRLRCRAQPRTRRPAWAPALHLRPPSPRWRVSRPRSAPCAWPAE